MTDTTDTPARLTFAERQKEAALAEVRERNEKFNRVADIVAPRRNDPGRRAERVTDVIALDSDHLVKLETNGETYWTFVVDGKRGSGFHLTQEAAILHLIASRYDNNPNSNIHAAHYAGRVLGIPASDDN
jgi:hypothetical protein